MPRSLSHESTLPAEVEDVGQRVLDAALRVHRGLGPGLLESVYQAALVRVLQQEGLRVDVEPRVPVMFEGESLGEFLRPDLVVEGQVLVEVKAVEEIHPVHRAQVVSYLRLTGLSLGYLLNFHVPRMQWGIKRFILSANAWAHRGPSRSIASSR